jgi:hypothetical protein
MMQPPSTVRRTTREIRPCPEAYAANARTVREHRQPLASVIERAIHRVGVSIFVTARTGRAAAVVVTARRTLACLDDCGSLDGAARDAR